MRKLALILALAACKGGDDTPADDTTPDDSDAPGRDSDEPPVDPDQRAQNLASSAGDFAADLLRAAPYTSLTIEIDHVAGNAPDSDAVDALVAAAEALCDKPDGVTVVLDDELPPQGVTAWSVQAAEDLEVAWRDRYRDPEAGDAVIYLLYLDGHSDRDSDSGKVLGYAVHGSSLVMFKESIEGAGSGLPLLAGVEEVVIVHELGHLLGLVNNGVEMVTPHQDTEHGHHDSNDRCIMYWAVETDSVADLLLSQRPDFDDACRADLRAAGGR